MVVDDVPMRVMGELEEVALAFNWDCTRRKPKQQDQVGARLGNLLAQLR